MMQNKAPLSLKRKLLSVVIAWLLFIGVDFLFHASLLASLWREKIPALKPLDDLALLIPAGYLSFLLLTGLIGYVFFKVFTQKPSKRQVLSFGLIFGLLFAMSNLFGLYSYVALPFGYLLVFNLVYLIEIIVVSLCLNYVGFSVRSKKPVLRSTLIFIGLIVLGIIIQNIVSISHG